MRQSYDLLNDVIHIEFSDGKHMKVAGRDVRQYGLAEVLRQAGATVPDERIPVKQGGRVVGTVAAYFTPMLSKSRSPFYDPRPHDFTYRGDHWEAHNQLGPGDLDAIPEFRWANDSYEADRAKRAEEERTILREAMFGRAHHPGATDEH